MINQKKPMLTPDWQLQTPLDALIFDCDGTLSQIEGIDALAAINDVGPAVKTLTEIAMGTTGINPEMYRERLMLTRPRADQMTLIGRKYIENLTEDIAEIISVYQRLEKKIFILSAGLLPAILPLARLLNIPESHVYGVAILFDDEGNFRDFDHASVLIQNQGKCRIVEDILKRHPRVGYIGDGLNDCPVQPFVSRFVGYGGACYRENIAALCDYYIAVRSMAPFLPLTLTENEFQTLSVSEKKLYKKGLTALQAGGVMMRGAR